MEKKIIKFITSNTSVKILFLLSILLVFIVIYVHFTLILNPKEYLGFYFIINNILFLSMFLIYGCTMVVYMNNQNERPFIKRVYEHTTILPIIFINIFSVYGFVLFILLITMSPNNLVPSNIFTLVLKNIISKFIKLEKIQQMEMFYIFFTAVLMLMATFTIPALYSEIVRRRINK